MGTSNAKVALEAKELKISSLTYAYAVIALFGIIYAYLTYRAALVTSSVHTNHVAFIATHVLIILPEILVWVIAARGAVCLKTYARTVIRNADGQALDYVANSLLLIVLYSILLSMATTVKALYVHTTYLKDVTIITNHTPLVIILLSSIYLYIGSRKLNNLVSKDSNGLLSSKLYISLTFFILIVLTFAWYFYRVAPKIIDDDGSPHFGMSARVMLFTYVLPHIITWLLGLLACLNIAQYAFKVTGKIYKKLFRDVYHGLVIVFSCTFLAQVVYILNISTKRLSPKMIPVFALLVLLVTGYLLIYRGVNQLYRLDE